MEEKLAEYLERMNFHDFVEQQLDVKLLIRNNFIAGLVRGLGLAIGGTFVLGVVVTVVKTIQAFFF